jgi:hypothetical protein
MSNVSRQTAAACDLIARLVEPTPGTKITRTRGTFDDPFGQQVFAGCRVLVAGSFTTLADHPSPDTVLENALPAEGWTQEPHWEADGPDGTDFAFRRGNTVCIVVGRWEGGVFEENDPPPSDRYDVNVGCIDRVEPLGAAPVNDSDAVEQR